MPTKVKKRVNKFLSDIQTGSICWRSPSNIALIKYWGKHGHQLPRNPSLSITLSRAFTETSIDFEVKEKEEDELSLEFSFDGQENEKFRSRIQQFLIDNSDEIPFINNLYLSIKSKNSFPHSSGIASSASSMSALALCIVSIQEQLMGKLPSEAVFLKKASDLARKASGSACRSIYPHMSLWGKTEIVDNSSNQYAIGYDTFDNNFKGFHDDILIVSPFEKKVSSSEGHQLMDNNRYAAERYMQANENLKLLVRALKEGDIRRFGKIVEDEALVLHALMMCSDPGYILMEANTLKIINEIRTFRQNTGTHIFFSLDAGPNVHVLYPKTAQKKSKNFITSVLKQYCHKGRIIEDEMGEGPVLIQSSADQRL